jgi:hypothetical protein
MEKSFYNIEIGNHTRAGNLQVQHHFVIGCDKIFQQYEVENYFRNQYKGFAVSATVVQNVIISTDINKPEFKVVKVSEVKKLSTVKISRIESSLTLDQFPEELRNEWRDLDDEQGKLNSEIAKLKDKLVLSIKERYNNAVRSAWLEKFNIRDNSLQFRADITGTVIIEEIEKGLKTK